MHQQILDGNVDMFLSCGYEPSSLENGCVPVDIDVSPFDNSGSHKAGVSRTDKNSDGYALILKRTMIAYNILRIIGTAAMKGNDMPIRRSTIKRRRIRTVIDNLILIAGHLTDHARKLRITLRHCNGWICTFLRDAESF